MIARMDLDRRIVQLAADRESGASEIVAQAIAILRDALAAGHPIRPVARAVCRAQPSMAPVWNAALEALAADDPAGRLDAFARRVTRAASAVVRVGVEFLTDEVHRPLRVVTVSYSRTVAALLGAVAARRPVRAACSEGRPALEGQRLAARLAAAGVDVTFFTDAAIAAALPDADAVIVGADAVTPEWLLNKAGTRMLAAAAAHQGVPLYVVATRDKFLRGGLADALTIRAGESAEVWDLPPAHVTVRNPYFERVPLELVASLITDAGVIGSAMAAQVASGAEIDINTLISDA
jgi:translation initiation factor 2B subunit (eIF-2B alpha/beta/delta family)